MYFHTFVLMTRYSLSVLILLHISSVSYAQTHSKKELARHNANKKWSATNHRAIASLDTIFNSGLPYAILKRSGSVNPSYNLFHFNGTHLLSISTECYDECTKYFHTFIFNGSGAKGEVSGNEISRMEEFIVNQNLVSDSGLNAASESKFLQKYPIKFSILPVKPSIQININRNMHYPAVRRSNDFRNQFMY